MSRPGLIPKDLEGLIPLYGAGMHEFVLRELEVGTLVALAEDDEACGFGPLWDLRFEQQMTGVRFLRANRAALRVLD